MDNLKPEHIQGKTIEKVVMEETAMEITFSDGSTAFIGLKYLGTTGDKLQCAFYYPSTDDIEEEY